MIPNFARKLATCSLVENSTLPDYIFQDPELRTCSTPVQSVAVHILGSPSAPAVCPVAAVV